VLPVNGSREALFAFAQCVVDPSAATPWCSAPTPSTRSTKARRCSPGRTGVPQPPAGERLRSEIDCGIPESDLARIQLVYVCSPATRPARCSASTNGGACSSCPTATASSSPATSAIRRSISTKPRRRWAAAGAARALGRDDYRNIVMFSSLSKRSNVPGLRSGFVAGDAAILKKFWLYRTYQGCAMSPPVQQASIAGLERRGARARQPPPLSPRSSTP
jgi:N-succinyldiaminopimelate aminotransferase